MELIFLDTSLLVAYYNADDVNHADARGFIRGMEGKRVGFLISDYIFDEILTVMLVRSGKKKAIEVCNAILRDVGSGSIGLLYVNEEVFGRATAIFTRFVDKTWSFTDCTSYILMRNAGIAKCASFDRHFYQFGFEVLP